MQKVFEAMSGMLKTSCDDNATAEANCTSRKGGMLSGDGGIIQRHLGDGGIVQRQLAKIKSDHWGCEIRHCNNPALTFQLNISLVRQKEGTPRFFNCALTTVSTST